MKPLLSNFMKNVCEEAVTQRPSRLTRYRSVRYKQDVLKQTRYGKIVFFLGSKFSRHPEGLRFTGLRSEFPRSLLSRNHFRNAFGRGRRRIKNSFSYAAATKKTCVAVIIVFAEASSQKPFQESAAIRFAKYCYSFRKVQIPISQSTDFHFAKYRFPFRKVQISFRFAKYRGGHWGGGGGVLNTAIPQKNSANTATP